MNDAAIESLNKKLSLAQKLVWLTSGLLALTVAAMVWVWTQLTSDFVRYGDGFRILHVEKRGTEFALHSGVHQHAAKILTTLESGEEVEHVFKPVHWKPHTTKYPNEWERTYKLMPVEVQ
ncbi:MAG: hypothetical protein AAGH68_12465 [Pseudomonadota bacterium]